jgi:hypothetical protein
LIQKKCRSNGKLIGGVKSGIGAGVEGRVGKEFALL